MRAKFSVFDGVRAKLDVLLRRISSRQAARESSFCQRLAPRRRIFIALSQADGRRGGYRLQCRTVVDTALPFMRRLILVRYVFYAARGIALRRNFINLSVRRFLKFRIIARLNCRLKFRR